MKTAHTMNQSHFFRPSKWYTSRFVHNIGTFSVCAWILAPGSMLSFSVYIVPIYRVHQMVSPENRRLAWIIYLKSVSLDI